jgi:hypothetical protein
MRKCRICSQLDARPGDVAFFDSQEQADEFMRLRGALGIQHGGDHYKKMRIQPVEYIHQNGLGFLEGNAIKYLSRHRDKGKADDIRKAIHYCELILELEYGHGGDHE